jgi:putative exosortase-associated protein (TIGR04073 family)
MKKALVVIVALSVLIAASVIPALAAETKSSTVATTAKKTAVETKEAAKSYPEAAGDKLAEGVGDAATGWTETPKEMVETSKETNPIEGVTVGTIKGAGKTVVKTTEGAVKAATFYAPGQQKKQDTTSK